MADDIRDPEFSTPDAFDDTVDDARAEELFDAISFDDLHAALAGLPHLDPTRAESLDEPAMPEWAWDRISGALASEAAVRAADTHDNVVVLPTAAAASASTSDVEVPADAAGTRGRHSRGARWGGGLVAASVTLIAVGFGYTAIHTTAPTPAIVGANRNIQPAAAAPLTASATTLASAQAFSMEASAADAVAEGPAPKAAPTPPAATPSAMGAPSDQPLVQPRSSVVQAARMVTDTGTAYQHEQLSGQVTNLLSTLGVQDAGDLATMPSATALPTDDGFTETWPLLRDCITWLTSDEQAQAVVVDRGTYEGQDAGVVVAPASDVVDPTSPAPTMSIDSAAGQLNIWVIDPSCKHVQSSIEDQMSMQLLP